MIKPCCYILIDNLDKVRRFNNLVNQQDYEVYLVKDTNIIDCKSLIGIFSCDIRNPFLVYIPHTEEHLNDFIETFDEFYIKKTKFYI